ncbi:unnamed protein product [Thlaspi arvense]|uniref:Uncharacterized protein n=1 Tax=Thlaspi arvense TaxID=13288 RepID=A0AAU9RF98_THLAR|nr:unnamed protein product [Thlaspi arvense]
MRNNMGDTVKASWYQPLSPLTNSAIAAELSHSIFSSETIFTLGTQYSPFPLTLMKARMSSNGKLGALVRQELVPSVYLTIAGDVDVRTEARSAKLGLSLAIKP